MTDRLTLEYCYSTQRDSLLNVALDVHMTAMGSMERQISDQNVDVAVLRYALKRWNYGRKMSKNFDKAVAMVIKQALEEDRVFRSCFNLGQPEGLILLEDNGNTNP